MADNIGQPEGGKAAANQERRAVLSKITNRKKKRRQRLVCVRVCTHACADLTSEKVKGEDANFHITIIKKKKKNCPILEKKI